MNFGQITSAAEHTVNNTSLGTITDMYLNILLNKLYVDYEWNFLIRSTTVVFASATASAALATDYSKHFHFKWVDGTQSPPQETNIVYKDFSEYVLISNTKQTATHPAIYTIAPEAVQGSSGTTSQILIWPTFDELATCTLFYYSLPGEISTDAGFPVFKDHAFLVDALTNELFKYLRDPRYDWQFIERNISRVRNNMRDFGGVTVPTIKLNPAVFKPWRSRRA